MMKAKRILCFVLVALLCFSLCGCRVDLDDLRDRVAYIQPDGQTLVLNGVEYRFFDVDFEIPANASYDEVVFVCEPDVPLLAAEIQGSTFFRSFDDVFLVSNFGDGTYCRSNRYEEVKQALEAAPEEAAAYRCVYDDAEYTTHSFVLTKEQIATFKEVITTESFSTSELAWGDWNEWRYRATLYPCNEAGIVLYGNPLLVLWDDLPDGTHEYVIVDASPMYDRWINLPETYVEAFDKIFAPVEEANGIDYNAW